MAKLKGLGRGLDALLAGDIASAGAADALRTLNVQQLQPGKYQPRTHMDQEAWQNPSRRRALCSPSWCAR